MSGFADYLEDKVLNYVFRNQAAFATATVYIALYTAVSNAEAGTGTEVSGFDYARTAVTFAASSGGVITNSGAAVTFPPANGGNWGTITHAGIRDAATSGNALTAITALASSVVINNGDTFRFPTSSVSVSLD